MAEANGFRWTTLRVAALYPLALVAALVSTLAWQATSYAPTIRAPTGASIVGLIAAGGTALAITRSFDLDWPNWVVALASYAAGGIAAARVFGYFQLVRSEFPPKRS